MKVLRLLLSSLVLWTSCLSPNDTTNGVSGFVFNNRRSTVTIPSSTMIRTVNIGRRSRCQQHPFLLFQSSKTELENEEPLSVIFQRAVVLQRSGSYVEALDEYELFLKASAQCDVEPSQYAEVYGNMGALFLRQRNFEEARHHLQQALIHRPKLGAAHVNLAVVALQQAANMEPSSTLEEQGQNGIKFIEQAEQHCQDALDANADPRSVAMAKRLLEDIDRMRSSSSPLGDQQ